MSRVAKETRDSKSSSSSKSKHSERSSKPKGREKGKALPSHHKPRHALDADSEPQHFFEYQNELSREDDMHGSHPEGVDFDEDVPAWGHGYTHAADYFSTDMLRYETYDQSEMTSPHAGSRFWSAGIEPQDGDGDICGTEIEAQATLAYLSGIDPDDVIPAPGLMNDDPFHDPDPVLELTSPFTPPAKPSLAYSNLRIQFLRWELPRDVQSSHGNHNHTHGSRKTDFAGEEVRMLRDFLGNHPWNWQLEPDLVVSSTGDSSATVEHAAAQLRATVKTMGKDELLVFYYVGHGWAATNPFQIGEKQARANWSIFQRELDKASCDVLVMLNCCSAETAIHKSKLLDKRRRSMCIIAVCKDNEKTWKGKKSFGRLLQSTLGTYTPGMDIPVSKLVSQLRQQALQYEYTVETEGSLGPMQPSYKYVTSSGKEISLHQKLPNFDHFLDQDKDGLWNNEDAIQDPVLVEQQPACRVIRTHAS